MPTNELAQSLRALREHLAAVQLPLPLPGADEQQRQARAMREQLDDYVLPRLESIDAPLLCVVGGSTGAGKSTLVNSLLGRRVTQPGVIRPTTRSPVLVHHPDDARWFDDERVLPGLIRATVSSQDARSLQLVAEPSLPKGLALIDAPDVDSVVDQNRALAAQLLQAADLWLFVTSAARYADAVPWDYLRRAVERKAAVAVVLNRVPPAAMVEVPPHLGQMMTERGLGDSALFAVPETTTDDEGMLPDSAVSPIRTWLATLAADQNTKAAVVMQTLQGAITSLTDQVPALASAADDQGEALEQLRQDALAQYGEASRAVAVQTADGTLLRGEVLARWHEFVGTGEFMRAVEQKISWLRDRVWGAIAGKPPEVDKMQVAVENGLEALVREEGTAAAERADAAWRANPAGRALLERHHAAGGEDLSRASAQFPSAVARMVRDWQGDVIELVSGEGMSKRSRARLLAFGINGASVALMVVIFAQTGGVTGAEIGIAGGTSVVAQRLLEALIGDDAVRKLATQAKADLDTRVQALMAGEYARYEDVLSRVSATEHLGDELRQAVADITAARSDDRALTTGADTEGSARPQLETGEQPQTITFNQLGAGTDHDEAETVQAELLPHEQGDR
ncbi:GTPase [Propionibacteriaceae bacterium G1746]|uniref:GTPase n=1 Tax=Aestuariimicrobium sp. G57 TaxID=3418485 RepID=UPI003C25E31B